MTVGSTIRAGAIERYDEAAMQVMPHAWKACGQTLTLRRQLESMPDGGLFVMAAPPDPFPCPPAPYERVSLIAAYFKQIQAAVEDHFARFQITSTTSLPAGRTVSVRCSSVIVTKRFRDCGASYSMSAMRP